MAVSIIAERYDADGNIMREYLCDRAEDLQTIKGFNAGAEAYVIAEKKRYIVNCCNEWCERPTSSGGGGITPAGVFSITANGEYDVTPYAKVSVNIASSGGDKYKDFLEGKITELTAEDFEGLTSIKEYAFAYQKNLKSVTIPETAPINECMFYYCSSLENVILPTNITEIKKSMFSSCSALEEITIPSSVLKINASAFMSCTALKKIKVEGTLTNIYSQAFYNCTSILEYDFTACTAVPTLATSASISVNKNTQIKVPSALYDTWIAATNWSKHADYIIGV